MQRRIIGIAVLFSVMFTVLYMRIYVIITDEKYINASKNQWQKTITVQHSRGNIFDRNFQKLVNQKYVTYAVINPTANALEEIYPFIADYEEFNSKQKYNTPFVCEITEKIPETDDITIFEKAERYAENQLAEHIIGYIRDDVGITGIESAYDDFLTENSVESSVTYSIDGQGNVLEGIEKNVNLVGNDNSGVVLTIDKYIQAICENMEEKIEKGAVVVMDVNSGDILAMASFPSFSESNLGEALSDENSPLINRCTYSYSVGSIFKLVTAFAAFKEGIDESMSFECDGETQVENQKFRCHDHKGHGTINMTEAMSVSCNPYFIELSKRISADTFYKAAESLGFGKASVLANGIYSSGGNLPDISQLQLPAEKANFSFGQGQLLATPLQICSFTSAIANEGKLYNPRLVIGTTENGELIKNEEEIKYTKVFDRNTSFRLQDLMIAAVNDNVESNARPGNVRAAGKTSTAQTGIFDENGEEICHAWITGYFPLNQPKYAVTVLCENGGYGNESAAPVFKEIAERITDIYG